MFRLTRVHYGGQVFLCSKTNESVHVLCRNDQQNDRHASSNAKRYGYISYADE